MQTGPCQIHYRDIGEYLTREEKLKRIEQSALGTIEWNIIQPNEAGDWISQRNDDFRTYSAIGDKKARPGDVVMFRNYSLGLATNRDAWCYNFSHSNLGKNIEKLAKNYNEQVDLVTNRLIQSDHVNQNPTQINWSVGLRNDLRRGRRHEFKSSSVSTAMYRPFCRQAVYFDSDFNERVSQLPAMFPRSGQSNFGFYVVAAGSSKPFSLLATRDIPDLAFWGSSGGQFFPRWIYEATSPSEGQLDINSSIGEVDDDGYRRVDAITDKILADYRNCYGETVNSDEIFYYVYGLLHSPDYRSMYAADLTKMLPRIPKVSRLSDFRTFADIGKRLFELHLGYETVEPYPLTEVIKDGAPLDAAELFRVSKMKYQSRQDRSAIVYNSWITLERIPPEAHEYMLASRSALDWVIRQYQVSTEKNSGITNDPNDWATEYAEPRYIIDLIKRVTTVSVRTVDMISQLPRLEMARD